MKLTQGSIVITAFPFADKSTKKVRPALVVSGNEFNKKSSDIWVTVITTQGEHTAHKIPLSANDLIQGALIKKSFVKFSSITYIDKHLLTRKVAQVKLEKMVEINRHLVEILKVSDL